MLRRTKIVATLGPATDNQDVLRKMIKAGLDVARINFSHGEADEHRRRARLLRETALECGRDVGVMGDLQGPKIRIRRFKEHSAVLSDGADFFLDSKFDAENGTAEGVGVALDTLHEDVVAGDLASLTLTAPMTRSTDRRVSVPSASAPGWAGNAGLRSKPWERPAIAGTPTGAAAMYATTMILVSPGARLRGPDDWKKRMSSAA
jgi:hypothetical protein